MKRSVILLVLGALLLAAAPGHADTPIVEQRVTFDVRNVNRSKVPCLTDGASYQIAAYLVAPATALAAPDRAVTVYLHGVMLAGTWLWRIKGYDGAYDFASRMAERGHTSLVIDRLGYGGSGIPYGNLSCLGGQADVVHQVIQHLRRGTYAAGGRPTVAFSRVALAGHSAGGLFAPVEAYSFRDVDALLGLSSAFDQGFPPSFLPNVALNAGATCARGGDRKGQGGPSGYTFTFAFPAAFFHDIDPALEHETSTRLERDPCGDDAAYIQTLALDRLYLRTIDVPVLLLAGENDFAFPPNVMRRQAALYAGANDLTVGVVEKAGHDYMLERGIVDGQPAAERLRSALDAWLGARGF